MNKKSRKHRCFRNGLLILSGLAIVGAGTTTQSFAQDGSQSDWEPALVITNEPLPEDLKEQVYSKPIQVPDIGADEITGSNYFEPAETLVTRKVRELMAELGTLQLKIKNLSGELNGLQRDNEQKSAEYYAAVATVNTQLQAGTTPGNPRLLKKLNLAGTSLDNLSRSLAHLNQIASDTAQSASEASFLLEETRAAYGLSGAIEEDHVRLAETEDAINNTVVIIERILNNVNDDITRTSTYLSSERNNLRTLSLAVANGDLYGKSLANRPFSNAAVFTPASASSEEISDLTPMPAAALSGPRPLVKIRFDRPDVEYEQPVYLAVNEALKRYPNAQFDLVAVHPSNGNAAKTAIESTKARRNAEKVLRTLTQMGMPLERINLSHSEDAGATTNEVHLFIR